VAKSRKSEIRGLAPQPSVALTPCTCDVTADKRNMSDLHGIEPQKCLYGLCSLNARQKRIRQKTPNEIYLEVCQITVWCFSQPQVSPHTVTYQRTRREQALLQISSLLSLEVTREKERNQKRVKMALDAFTQYSCRKKISSCNLRFNHKTCNKSFSAEIRPWSIKITLNSCRHSLVQKRLQVEVRSAEPFSSTPLSRSGRCWRP